MKLSLENTQKKQRVKNLWKVDYPPQDPELRWIWIYQVQDHLFGTREMQNKLLKAWGFSYTRKDRRKKPLRDKMSGISLRAPAQRFRQRERTNCGASVRAGSDRAIELAGQYRGQESSIQRPKPRSLSRVGKMSQVSHRPIYPSTECQQPKL